MSVPQKTLEPPLRFPEFSGAWEDRRLGEQASFLKGKSISKADICENGEVSCIRYGELYTTYGEVITSTVSKTNLAINDLILSQRNDVIIPASGETALDIATASCVTLDGIALSGDINIIRSKMDGRFLAYILSHSKKLNIARLAQGNSVVHLYKSQLESLLIVIPKHPEQKKIADYLGAVDAKLRLLERRRDALRNYKKGMMQRIFSQEIRFTQDDGTAFPDWQERRLGELGSFLGGGTPTTNEPSYWEGDIPWISSSDISEESITTISVTRKISRVALINSATKLVPSNSLLIVSRVGVGKFAVSKIELCTSQDFCNFTPKDDYVIFIAYWLSFNRNSLLSLCQGTSIKGLTSIDLKKLNINLPHPEEQQKIADFLSAVDDKIIAAARQIVAMQDFKKSMLQQMFV